MEVQNLLFNFMTKTERGTKIILHIAEDSVEFLEEFKIRELLTK